MDFITEPSNNLHDSWSEVQLDYRLLIGNFEESRFNDMSFPEISWFKRAINGVATITNGVVEGENGWPMNRAGDVLEYLTWFGGIDEPRIMRIRNTERSRLFHDREKVNGFLPGRTLSLLSAWSLRNWGHFLLDSLGRLAVLNRVEPDLNGFDQVLIPAFPGKHASILTDQLFPKKIRVVRVDKDERYRCEELVVPTISGGNRVYSQDLPEYFRNISKDSVKNERIFIPRYVNPRRFIVTKRCLFVCT